MNIRKADYNDCLNILNWRNDYLTRTMSLNNKKIKISDHKKWFDSVLYSKMHLLLIGENVIKNKTNKIGMIRFDFDKNKAKISINLNPIFRGMGYGKIFLRECLKLRHKYFKEINEIIAEIKTNNYRSIKIFKQNGFIGFDINKEIQSLIYYYS